MRQTFEMRDPKNACPVLTDRLSMDRFADELDPEGEDK